MDGVHDLGGMHGFGAVPIDPADRVFHEPWEARVWAMTQSLVRRTTIDRFRYTIEQMPPAEYLGTGYYARWLWAAERLAEDEGILAGGGRAPGGGHPAPRPSNAPIFEPGDRVRVRSSAAAAHTRVPRYLRRAEGVIERIALFWPSPTESAATGTYGPVEPVYTVRFPATELFGPGADHVVSADLPEPDLEAA